MSFECDDLDAALENPERLPEAREHAEACPSCREQLAVWDEISRVAPELHTEWESPELWPRISESLQEERVSKPSIPLWRWALAAAAVVTIALVLSLPRHPATTPGNDLLTDAALTDVQKAEAVYVQAIDRLAAVAGAQIDGSASPLAAAYREKLLLIDSAIGELKEQVQVNRYNAYLRVELASLYGEKQKTLQDWLANANHN